ELDGRLAGTEHGGRFRDAEAGDFGQLNRLAVGLGKAVEGSLDGVGYVIRNARWGRRRLGQRSIGGQILASRLCRTALVEERTARDGQGPGKYRSPLQVALPRTVQLGKRDLQQVLGPLAMARQAEQVAHEARGNAPVEVAKSLRAA